MAKKTKQNKNNPALKFPKELQKEMRRVEKNWQKYYNQLTKLKIGSRYDKPIGKITIKFKPLQPQKLEDRVSALEDKMDKLTKIIKI